MTELTANSTQKAKAAVRDWTRGSIVQNILLLAWPVMVLGILYAANLILEMVWVGRLGASAIAGVGVAGFIVLLVVSFKTGLSIGERAMVARFIGQGDMASANRVAGQAFLVSALYGIIVFFVGAFLAGRIFSLFNLQAEVLREGTAYLRLIMMGWLTEAFWMTAFGLMQASGDVISPMKAAIVLRVINALLCPFMVLGLWIFPPLGVRGAAITYVSATGVGMVICLWMLFSGRTRLKLSLKDFFPDPKLIWRMLKIGLPGGISAIGSSFADLVLTSIMIPFGTAPLAAHNVLSRVEMFINTPGMGLGTAAGVLVGQNLGAKQPQRAVRSGWLAAAILSGFMLCCTAAVFIWARQIIGIFNTDPQMVAVGADFLRIASAGYLAAGLNNILSSNISGAGDTLPPMLISLGRLWLIMIPLAFLLTRYTSLGAYSIRWAIVISLAVGAAVYVVYFLKGRWMRKKV
jgi:putative MATE family efflux protein